MERNSAVVAKASRRCLTAAFAFSAVLLLIGSDTCDAELELLISLSRHGSRAPNPVVRSICPLVASTLDEYEVPLQEMTKKGVNQLRKAGEHVREVYMDQLQFLSPTVTDARYGAPKFFDAYFRADSADRCGQSAIEFAYGMYSEGNGTKHPHFHSVPVYMQLLQNEVAFAATKNICKSLMKKDVDHYAKTRAKDLFSKNSDLLNEISSICGIHPEKISSIPGGEDEVMGLKDIADAFEFDRQEGLPTNGLPEDVQDKTIALAFQMLMERYYSTNRMITYWCGAFPSLVLQNIHDFISRKKQYKYYSYHGHRELLHGFALMLGWSFDFPGLPKTMNSTSLHPATTMFFELHSQNQSANQIGFFVKTYVWSQQTGRLPVVLQKCSENCPLEQFERIITDHINETGTWDSICRPPLYHHAELSLFESFCHYIGLLTIILSVVLFIGRFLVPITRERLGYKRLE